MATTLDVVKANAKNGTPRLKISFDGKDYVLGSGNNLSTLAEAGVAPVEITGAAKKRILNAALIEIEENGAKLTDDVKKALPTVIEHFEGSGVIAERLSEVKGNIANAAKIETADAKTIETILEVNPEAKAYATKKAQDAISKHGIDVAAIDKKIAEAATKTKRIADANSKLETLLTTAKADPKKIESFLHEHAEILDELKPSADALGKVNGAKFNFETAVREVKSEFSTVASELETQTKRWVELKDHINSKPGTEALKAAETEFKEVDAAIKEIQKGKFGKAVNGSLPAELKAEVAAVDASFAKSLGHAAEGAEKGAKLIGGGKWYSFMHTAETVGKDVSKIGKFRWGKAAVIGIPAAGLIAYVAGVGRKPEEKYTSMVNDQQQAQAAGRA